MIISLSPILYIIEVVQLVVVSLTRQADPQVSQDAVPLNDSTNHHSAQEAEESEEEGEDPGPEAAAAGVTAGVTLAAGRAVLSLLLALLDWLLHHRIQTFPTLGQISFGLKNSQLCLHTESQSEPLTLMPETVLSVSLFLLLMYITMLL